MGVEHSIKEEPVDSMRCPYCHHLSTLSCEDGKDKYWYCRNPRCNVERIYGDNAVMVSCICDEVHDG